MCFFMILKQNIRTIVSYVLIALFLIWFFISMRNRELPVYAASDDSIALPIIMYHSILKDESRTGKYVITPQQLEEDMKYLRKHGYETVTVTDVINFVKNDGALPSKPVMLTFDDGYRNNLTYLLPLLETYDMKAVISVVGEYAEKFSNSTDHNISYAHLTWSDISELVESGHVEIQNHSYAMHSIGERKGSMKMSTETIAQYRETFVEDAVKNQTALLENCGIEPNTYTYPYGRITTESIDFLREIGFEAALTCYEYVNYIDSDPTVLMHLGRFNRPGEIKTDEFMKKILP